jgi:pimeloyl-ACP methyl ester carboxylesterase
LLERDGVRLACQTLGGGSPVILLHGLAGHAAEWSQTARWLSEHHHVVAFDARGHGGSERVPPDVSRSAHIADAAYVIEQMGLEPCAVIGQSIGGVTALLLAAAHPALVQSLIVAEAAPVTPDETGIKQVEQSLSRWPVPFPTRAAAVEFFGGPSIPADAWADGLRERQGGWWPQFDIQVMLRTLREAPPATYWQEWAGIRCPTLIVRGQKGALSASDARRMLDTLPGSRAIEIAEAGHDVHLEQSIQWQHAIEEFLGSLE